VREVGLERLRLRAGRTQRLDRVMRIGPGPAVVHRHVVAVPRELERDRAAEPARGASHEHDAAWSNGGRGGRHGSWEIVRTRSYNGAMQHSAGVSVSTGADPA